MMKTVLAGKIAKGELVISQEPWLSYGDQGLLYGYGLFETMRVYGGKVFALHLHLERLAKSCCQLGITCNFPLEQIAARIRECAEKMEFSGGGLRLTITRGNPYKEVDPCLLLTWRDLTYSSQDYVKGFTATTYPVRKNQTSLIVYHKTLNYLENIIALEEARRSGFQEALFLNTNNYLTEGAISNLFFFKGGLLYTPAVTCGLLAGITRRIVIDLAAARGYQVIEGEYFLEDLLAADEAFLTNSLMEIMPLVKVDSKVISDGKPGRVTSELMGHYQMLTIENF